VRDYLARQIAWFEQVLADLEDVGPNLDEAQLTAVQAAHAAHVQQMARFETECRRLLESWHNATGISEANRAAVRALAQRAERLAEQTRAAYERALQVVAADADRVKGALRVVARGRDLLGKYYPAGSLEAHFIDKKT
jgi:hypothetical protein